MNRKTNIFRIIGDKQTTIDLGHVSLITLEGNRITFLCYNTTIFVDVETEEAAKVQYEQILNAWVENAVGPEQKD